MEEMIGKIKNMTLTRTDRVIAEYILENMDTIGLQTSTTLAQEIDVSDTSIIRFIRKLGFKGYAEFRTEMNARMARQYDQIQRNLSPGEKYAQSRELLKQDSLINDVGNYTLDNLQRSYAKLDNKTVDQIVDIILSSKRKYVAAFRGAACCAHYMASKLVLLTSGIVPLVQADATSVERLMDITQDDCLIVYSFPRYSKLNYILMDLARERGAKIILFTDQMTSTLADKADVIVIAYVKGLGFTNSYVVPLSLSEVILLAISSRKDANCEERMSRIDRIMLEQELY